MLVIQWFKTVGEIYHVPSVFFYFSLALRKQVTDERVWRDINIITKIHTIRYSYINYYIMNACVINHM